MVRSRKQLIALVRHNEVSDLSADYASEGRMISSPTQSSRPDRIDTGAGAGGVQSVRFMAADIEGVSRRPNGIAIRLVLSPRDFG